MFRKTVMMSVLMLAMGTLAPACGDDSDDDDPNDNNKDTESDTGEDADGGDGGEDIDTSEDVISITLNVPEAFDGTPEILGTVFFENAEMTGMPSAMGDFINNPDIVAGEPFEFTTSQTGLDGEYYVAVTLYCEGGGGGQYPVGGVDWIAGNGQAVTLGPGTGTVDAGEMTLMLLEE